MRHWLWPRLGLGLLALVWTVPASGSDPPPHGSDPPPPSWRFRDSDRPIKAVLLAGSIGARKRDSYLDRLESFCSAVEFHNLSTVGVGAGGLRGIFRKQVLENRQVSPRRGEHWLIFQGGLNSVGAPHRTNHHIRQLFVQAHRAGFSVLSLSLTPWGDDSDRRWRGAAGVRSWRATRSVVDFMLARSTALDALGDYRHRRTGDPDAPWHADERGDIVVDLYDSALRDRDAPQRMIEAIEGSEGIEATEAAEAADLPRWYLRRDLRSFDHIHPNAGGHAIIATLVCPHLPLRWGCACPPA